MYEAPTVKLHPPREYKMVYLEEVSEEDVFPLVETIELLCTGPQRQARYIAISPSWYQKTIEERSEQPQRGGPITPGWWEDNPKILRGGVQVFRAADVYYLPSTGTIITELGQVLCRSVAEAKFAYPGLIGLPYVCEVGEQIQFNPPDDIETISRAIVTVPWGAIHNYGHFILDCLPAAHLLRQLGVFNTYDFITPPLAGWQKRHLSLAGISGTLETPKEIYLLRDAILTSCADHFLHCIDKNAWALREDQLNRIRKTDDNLRSAIYISRRFQDKRRLDNEEALENTLIDYGLTVYRPEDHTIDHQIQTFADANIIIGATGAALANVLYCARDTRVIEIQPTTMYGIWVRNLCALVGCSWIPYFCEGHTEAELLNDPQMIGRHPFSFNLDAFVKFLENEVLSGAGKPLPLRRRPQSP